MKKVTALVFVLLFSLTLLGCNKVADEPESFEGMTEEQQIDQMIKMIEAEEARMIESGEMEANQ